jgi:hypothetical protein
VLERNEMRVVLRIAPAALLLLPVALGFATVLRLGGEKTSLSLTMVAGALVALVLSPAYFARFVRAACIDPRARRPLLRAYLGVYIPHRPCLATASLKARSASRISGLPNRQWVPVRTGSWRVTAVRSRREIRLVARLDAHTDFQVLVAAPDENSS